jgi:RNA polymerase sigma factor (sigma-70 family)
VAVARFEDRIDRYRGELLAFIARRAPTQAEEISQETWMRVSSARPNCPDEASFRGYIYTVARRLLIDHHRRSRARVQLVPIEGGLEPSGRVGDPHASVVAGETLVWVERTLSEMQGATAEVFRLRMTTSMTFKEIAEHQGVGLNTALGRMHNATKKIRAALKTAGLIEGGSP